MATGFIASLGGQPQVITLTLDLLLQRGEVIDFVWVLFPAGNPRYQEAHRQLQRAFAREPYQHIQYQARPLNDSRGRPLRDLREPQDVESIWEEVRGLIQQAKADGHRLHISLSGGRRLLALMLFSAAMLYGSLADRVWHIYTPPAVLQVVRDGARLHVPPEAGVRLLAVPFTPWGAFFPGLKPVLGLSPAQVFALQQWQQDEETRQRCAWVWQRLTPRRREVLRALVEHPTRQAAADALGLGLSTIDTHRAAILETCRLAWPDEQVDLRFVRRVFRGWLLAEGRG